MTNRDDHLTTGTYAHGFGVHRARQGVNVLGAKFLAPPFSVLDTKQGSWIKRRRMWLDLGIKSELGREGIKSTYQVAGFSGPKYGGKRKEAAAKLDTTSIFDPVLCELAYSWWCKPGGVIVDPFAGGSVRGVVASKLGYRYWGCELRAEQVAANRDQLTDKTRGGYAPRCHQGDTSTQVAAKAPPADFIFSCPPYGSLEVYSDDPADISGYDKDQFAAAYTNIIGAAVDKLRPNRFACFVVGNYRDSNGHMVDLAGLTVQAFAAAGAAYYNDIVLLNSIGTGPLRVGTSFVRGARKVVKCHQNVLVFIKGCPKLAAADIPTGDEK